MSPTIAQVIVAVRSRQVDRVFDYLIPEHLAARVQPGSRVLVPFGRRVTAGYVVGIAAADGDTSALKTILDAQDERPLFTKELLDLATWLCDRYVCTRVQALEAMLPSAFRVVPRQRYRASGTAVPAADHPWAALVADVARRPLDLDDIVRRYGDDGVLLLTQALAAGHVISELVGEEQVAARQSWWLLADAGPQELLAEAVRRARRARQQADLLETLAAERELSLAAQQIAPSNASVKALVRDGLARLEARAADRKPTDAITAADVAPPELTAWQARALRDISASVLSGEARTLVMHGVTGSGKTEVYLRAISEVRRSGGSAIVLVPEIALTPQLVGRFQQRFGADVAVLHSGLSAGERRDEWLKLRDGKAHIAVGARSAVFAPLTDIRLIIVDEEHESSYKQEESPRYDAREVALQRANRHGAAVVLASATPSVVTMHLAETSRAQLITLPVRANGRPLPQIEVVDMREELRDGNRSQFSRALADALEQAVSAGTQAILFLNRRGFAAFVLCRSCGECLKCPRCDIALTLHRPRGGGYLSCHYCEYRQEVPEVCPTCGEPAMRPFGIGTEQVEAAVHERWPDWRTLRMDVDTTRHKGAHKRLIESFLAGEADVLIGTQMIAKGLDFPNVSLVGVIAADTLLAVPDYRSSERAFQLITQVSGRAGRAHVDGRTIVQTYRPDHVAVTAAVHHNYRALYERELAVRKQFHYPPFCELTVFVASHAEERIAKGAAARFEREVRRRLSAEQAVLLPAAPCGIRRVEDKFRFQVVVKYLQWEAVKEPLAAAFHTVEEKMRRLNGACVLDVSAGRII